MMFLIMQFSPSFHHFIPLGTKFPLTRETKVSHLYRATGKVTVLCGCIFTCLGCRPNWMEQGLPFCEVPPYVIVSILLSGQMGVRYYHVTQAYTRNMTRQWRVCYYSRTETRM
jgi:hypothetical protein